MLAFTAPRIRLAGTRRIHVAGLWFALALTHAAKHTDSLAMPDMALRQHLARYRVEQHRYPIRVAVEEITIEIDIEHVDRDASFGRQRGHEGERFVAEGTPAASEERDARHDARAIFTGSMRPFTVIVLIALLVLLVGAFVIKMQSIGFTP